MAVTNEEDKQKPLPTAAEAAPPLPSTRCPPPPPVSKRANVYFDEELAVQHEEGGVQAWEPRAQPSSSAPGPDRSSGPTNQWRPEINHLFFSSVVLHDKLPDKKSIEGLLSHNGSFINAVMCESVRGAEQAEMSRLAQENVLQGKTIHQVCTGCFVVTNNAKCQGARLLPGPFYKFGFTLSVVEVTLQPPQPAVVIGLLRSPLAPEDPSPCVLDLTRSFIEQYGIRILTGIFPNCKNDSKLVRMLFQAGTACLPLRQSFWGYDGCQYAWPHQVVVFGPTKGVFAVADEANPSWGDLVEHFYEAGDDFLDRIYEQMTNVEASSQTNAVWAKNLSQARIAATTQKSVNWKWWLAGTNHIVLWVDGRTGAERRGAACHKKQQAKWAAQWSDWKGSKRKRST